MKEYAKGFYKSARWKRISRLYMESKNYVCERCGGVGVICHHKKYITPANINDLNVTLSMDNLECLCQACHNREHMGKCSRAIFDDQGDMIGVKESSEIEDYKKAIESIDQLKARSDRMKTESGAIPPGFTEKGSRPQTGGRD